jgi:hypothetical protein
MIALVRVLSLLATALGLAACAHTAFSVECVTDQSGKLVCHQQSSGEGPLGL